MTAFYAIMRDYFADNFTDYFAIILRLLRLFHGVGTPKMGMCKKQFLTQSRRNDRLVSMKNACASASTGRRADRRESCLMERSCTIIRMIFSILRIICLG